MKKQSKTIGLIGGMSWESSKLYYEIINKRMNEVLGDSHSAKLIMVSVNFEEIKKMTFANNWEGIGVVMAKSAKQLEKAGADSILLCTNLIHLVSDKIKESVAIPLLHIADATGEKIQQQKLQKVLLLGTKYTMEKDFYTSALEDKYGLEVMVPETQERQTIHDIIYNELVKGIFTEKSRKYLCQVIEDSKSKGAEGAILGCTEIPMLIADQALSIPTFDTAKIHAYKAVEWAVSLT
ncbi:aspartate/glutamate racemase family protein [Aquimarina sp. AD10]|uniref:aspartate/glutamate racemase family protein n=1 Tax=Aquimarina TaxID=290174 RepID=UPI000E4FA114|nr:MULTISPECIES: aspartate/glutamate racemase family protein [Aquimarina]AXT59624.1 aspartate/glutamate racemase family protein [Aquimarina sp. AD10]RKM94694.1 amino acid racemase [Aquimarina sp. AD10]